MSKVLAFISSKESGVTTEEIQREFPEISLAGIVSELNALAKAGSVDIFRTKTGMFYRENKEAQQFSNSEEKILYLLIKEAGNDGIWIKDIKTKSGLHHNLITKILRNLEQRLLIKSVKSIKQNRKVYMLYGTVPSADLGDGPWFMQDGELDVGFVDAIKSVIIEWVSGCTEKDCLPEINSLPECKNIHMFVMRSGISSIPLSIEDIERILNLLVYERKILCLGKRYMVLSRDTITQQSFFEQQQ